MRLSPLPLLAVVASLAFAAPAAAAPVVYTADTGGFVGDSLTFDGDSVTEAYLSAAPRGCTSNLEYPAIQVKLPAGPVPIADRQISFEGDSTVAGVTGSGVHYAVAASLSSDRRDVRGSITLSGLHTSSDSGCPAQVIPFLAVPKMLPSEARTGHVWSSDSLNLRFDYDGTAITSLRLVVRYQCGNRLFDLPVDTDALGVPPAPVSAKQTWTIRTFVPDGLGRILDFELRGAFSTKIATTTAAIYDTGIADTDAAPCQVVDRPYLTTHAVAISGDQSPPPTPGTTTHRAGPLAIFEWVALKYTRAADTRYYFIARRVRCRRGATHVRFTFPGGRVHVVRCGAKIGYASGPLAPGQHYFARFYAVKLRHGRLVKKGLTSVEPLDMPAAEGSWPLVAHLPGPPPLS